MHHMLGKARRYVADVTLMAVLVLGWIAGTMATVEHWGWNADFMGALALAPFVLGIVLHVFGRGFLYGCGDTSKWL